uniref:DNA-directed RNA polymerase n=1 Tax=Syphacia muris TaxID=451379 RepID=A0A0N5AYD1_9BILA
MREIIVDRSFAVVNPETNFRGCQQWRVDFSVNYFKFYRLLYCSTIEDWPHSREVQQSMGEKLQLYQDVYAFTSDR